MLFCKRTRIAAKVTFVLPFDDPDCEVYVVGDFNDWRPGAHPLTRSTFGTRAVTVTLPLNRRYAFRYMTDGGSWFDDPDIPRTAESHHILTT